MTHLRWLGFTGLIGTACVIDEPASDRVETDTDVDVVVALDGPCLDAAERLGQRVCVHQVPDDATWRAISRPAGTAIEVATTKYMVPVPGEASLPTLFLDVHAYQLHAELLAQGFPDLFPALTSADYLRFVLYPNARRFWSGVISEYAVDGGGTRFGFTLWDDPADVTSTITEADALAAHRALQAQFGLGALAFVPSTPAQITAATAWRGGLDVYDPSGAIDLEVYTPGTAYGTVRRVPISGLAAAHANATFGHQDILVLDVAPSDVERPIAGAITGTRQADLSHLNVRSAARGTPNCYIQDAWNAVADWQDQLVKFTCAAGGWQMEAANLVDAQAWWDAKRPTPVALPVPDLAWTGRETLDEVDVSSPSSRSSAVARYGSKGAQLALLYTLVDDDLQYDGFLLPMGLYADQMATAGWTVDLGDGAAWHSFQATLDAWLADETFLSDAVYRRGLLLDLHDAIAATPADEDVVDDVIERIVTVFGDTTTMVRFRSSSNAEDALSFGGAGLYTSVRACAADDLDDDDAGPSRCDATKATEQTVSSALAAVWASTWNVAAYEERAYYGMDPSLVGMGVLVNDRATSERANIVAFSGVPGSPGDDRVLVNSQLGDLEVVSLDPGVVAERVLVDTSSVGAPVIQRVTASTVVPPGQWIASDATLLRVASVLDDLRVRYPIDAPVPPNTSVLLDTEWKILSDGRLVIKQIRPFLRSDTAAGVP